ncbi:MAG: hypothetical protein JJT89_00665 [Nitriliruptoraceae bacterium]|nr:hypothetical protein [Nitriliruptoraceae bacterium]
MSGELDRHRQQARVLEEQLAHQREVADEARMRALLDEHAFAERDERTAAADLRRHDAQLSELRTQIRHLDDERDRLLDQLLDRPPVDPA